MQRISQSLTGNHALSWLLKMPSIKKKMPSLSLVGDFDFVVDVWL